MAISKIVALSLGFFLLFQSPAYAYLDPGTGSLVMQIMAAALIGLAAGWRIILNFFKKIFKRSDP